MEFVSSLLCVWNQMPLRNHRIIMLPLDFCMYSFDDSTVQNMMLWIDISESHSDFFFDFS